MSNPNVSYCEKGVQLCHSEGENRGVWQCAGSGGAFGGVWCWERFQGGDIFYV